MMYFACFMAGGFCGICVMCLVQTNRVGVDHER